MEFGWCGPLAQAEAVAAAGFDYFELQVVPLNLEDDAAYAVAQAGVAKTPLPIRAMSLLYPRDLLLVGPDADHPRARHYFVRVADLLQRSGAGVVVLGGGRSRHIPDGWDRARAEQQLSDVLNWSADQLAGTGAVVALEPLNHTETNFILTILEAVALVGRVGRPEVRVLADHFHMTLEHQDFADATRNAATLAHAHVAGPNRQPPGPGANDVTPFFRALKAGGYTGRISAECFLDGDIRDALAGSIRYLRSTWDAA